MSHVPSKPLVESQKVNYIRSTSHRLQMPRFESVPEQARRPTLTEWASNNATGAVLGAG